MLCNKRYDMRIPIVESNNKVIKYLKFKFNCEQGSF